ncbi:MAG: cobalamin-binding protein [Actinobacteria bacterium]|nr:cobalamin-binding protein [Actinomycetota bacterium]
MARLQSLIAKAVEQIEEEKALSLVEFSLRSGEDPLAVLGEAKRGLEEVIAKYNQGELFLADLVVAADIFRQVQVRALGADAEDERCENPHVVFGTVQSDIHDIGKNITIAAMRYYGLRVLDLGVDVPPRTFVEYAGKTGAPIVCLSGLISDAYEAMRKTVSLLKRKYRGGGPVTIIGGLVNESVCEYVGADFWAKDCNKGAELCASILHERNLFSARTARKDK